MSLKLAAQFGRLNDLEALLADGSDPNDPKWWQDGVTPLHFASQVRSHWPGKKSAHPDTNSGRTLVRSSTHSRSLPKTLPKPCRGTKLGRRQPSGEKKTRPRLLLVLLAGCGRGEQGRLRRDPAQVRRQAEPAGGAPQSGWN